MISWRLKERGLALAFWVAAGQVPAAAGAQALDGGESYWIGVGLGGGSVGLDCTGCAVRSEEGVAGYLRFGTVLTPRLLVGVQLDTWIRRSDQIKQDAQSLTVLAHGYPLRGAGLWLGASVGFARYDERIDEDEVATHGPAAAVSAGWDVALNPSLAIQPSVAYLRQLSGGLEMNGSGLGIDAKLHLIQIGIGVSWRQP